ncbi:MAG TPA: hypothetical protein VFE45_06680, partial [Coriobacteriia bacterium]|nr:hypothetical protein [Coriobacteriia bacterium]
RFTADPDELAYVVFDAEGRLGQMLLVVNARELPLPEQRLLETFLHYRRAVGEEPVELPEPSASSPAVGRVRSFDYVSCEPAFDGTRSILVLECGRTEAVLVTDSERTVIDRLCLDDVPVNPTTGRFPRVSRANKNPHWWPDNSPRAGVRRVWLVARALGGWIRACGVRSPGGATRPARACDI